MCNQQINLIQQIIVLTYIQLISQYVNKDQAAGAVTNATFVLATVISISINSKL